MMKHQQLLVIPLLLQTVQNSLGVVIRTETGGSTGSSLCSCVPFFACVSGGSVEGQCASTTDVCCADEVTDPPKPAITPPRCSTRGTGQGFCVDYAMCDTEMQEHLNSHIFAEFVAKFGCGRARPGGNMRVCCSQNPFEL